MVNQPKKRGAQIGSKNAWKEKVGYSGIHKWIVKERKTPSYCEHCKISKAPKLPKDRIRKRSYFQWANISGEYKRDVTDWVRLCWSCHCKYDKAIERINK